MTRILHEGTETVHNMRTESYLLLWLRASSGKCADKGIGSQHFKETGLQVLDLIWGHTNILCFCKMNWSSVQNNSEDVIHGKGDSRKPLIKAEASLGWTKTEVRKVPVDEKVGQRKDA
jgi:hypothetical protein